MKRFWGRKAGFQGVGPLDLGLGLGNLVFKEVDLLILGLGEGDATKRCL